MNAKHGKSGVHKDKRKGRGGAKNRQQEYLVEASDGFDDVEKSHKLYVKIEERSYFEESDWYDRDTEDVEIEFQGVYRSAEELFSSKSLVSLRNKVEVTEKTFKSDEVYLVSVRFTDGDTFGRREGAWYLEGIYSTPEQAAEVEKAIREKTYEGYKPWEGYFETLQDVEIHKLLVEENYPEE